MVVGGGVRYEGKKLLPDVDERCEEVAGYITPRVGGVGPTTIAMLFRNAVEAAERERRSMIATCALCGTEHTSAIRCPECNVDPGFGPDRPSPFASATLWAMMGGIAAVFLVTLLVVALT